MMTKVKSLDEIKNNMMVLDRYINKKVDPEYSYALELIKRGICFIADSSSGQWRFYPSRFIGYADNSMSKHQANDSKDGGITNPAISKIFNKKPSYNKQLEEKYLLYCESLGIIPMKKGSYGVVRKFWEL